MPIINSGIPSRPAANELVYLYKPTSKEDMEKNPEAGISKADAGYLTSDHHPAWHSGLNRVVWVRIDQIEEIPLLSKVQVYPFSSEAVEEVPFKKRMSEALSSAKNKAGDIAKKMHIGSANYTSLDAKSVNPGQARASVFGSKSSSSSSSSSSSLNPHSGGYGYNK